MADGSSNRGGQIEIDELTNISTCEILFSKTYTYPPFCVLTSEIDNSRQPYALPPLDITTTSTGFMVKRRGGVNLESRINYVCVEPGQ